MIYGSMLEGIRGGLSRWDRGWRYANMTYQLDFSHGFRCLFLWVVAPQYTNFALVWGAMSINRLHVIILNIILFIYQRFDAVRLYTFVVQISPPWLGCLMSTFIVYLMALLLAVGFGFLLLVVWVHRQGSYTPNKMITPTNIRIKIIASRNIPL